MIFYCCCKFIYFSFGLSLCVSQIPEIGDRYIYFIGKIHLKGSLLAGSTTDVFVQSAGTK